jgi:dTDP-4-amino-4,6-dideoxygalactose transaminase
MPSRASLVRAISLPIRVIFPIRLNYLLFGRQGRASASEMFTGSSIILRQRYSIVEGSAENFVSKKERKFASLLGYDFAIACGSGGVAIQLSLRALNLDHGDKVAVQHNTCVATAQAILAAQLIPIFVKTEPGSFLLDKDDLQKQIQEHNVKVIIATHLAGGVEDIENLVNYGNKLGVSVIEDSCLSLVPSPSKQCFAKLAIISFGFSKPISVGEGAVIFTNDKLLASELKALRHWGLDPATNNDADLLKASWNGRITYLQLAIATSKIKHYKLKRKILLRRIRILEDLIRKFGIPLGLYKGSSDNISTCGFNSVVFKFDPGLDRAMRDQILSALRRIDLRFRTAFFPSIPTFPIFQRSELLPKVIPAGIYKSNYKRSYQSVDTSDIMEFFSVEEKDLIAVYFYIRFIVVLLSFRTTNYLRKGK